MLRDKFCSVGQNFQRRHRRTNTQFLKIIIEEEQKCRALRAQEIQMTTENPINVAQKLETDICTELAQLEREKFLETKRQAMLHQNEDEIRLLDVQIKRAHIQKQLIEQKALREKMERERTQANLEANKRYAEECKRNAEMTRQEERENARKKEMFRLELLKQMKERAEIREREKEEIKNERESMFRYIKKLKDDEEQEKKRAKMLKDTAKQEMEDYLRQNELYKQQQKRDEETDLKNQLELIRQRDEENKLRIEQRRQKALKQAALSEHIGEQIFNMEMEKQKHNDQLLELLVEERLAKDDQHFKQQMQQHLETTQNLRADLQSHLWLREQQQELNRQRKLKAQQKQLNFYQQELQKSQQQKQMKFLKAKDYSQELFNTVAQKRLDQENEAKERQMAYQQQLDLAKKRCQEIENEKLRLLQTEPRDILKFLPKQAISDDHRKVLGLTCKETK